MKRLKTNAGITLVALIITIIVLLILAVVSIRAITGGEGIFTKTENATQRYEEARLGEENNLNSYENSISKYMPTEGNSDEQEYIRQLYEKAINGDNTAQSEINQYQKSVCLFMKDGIYNRYAFIVETENGKYEYLINQGENSTVEILTTSYEYYDDVQKLKKDYYATRTAFIGKNIGDFVQERIDETHWKIKDVPGMYASEIQLYYYYGNDCIMFTYDSSLSIDKFTLKSDSISIVDEKLTGIITDVGQED